MKLECIDVRQQFGKAVVLNGCTFATADIRALVLIGPSGGGKSTLLRILAGLDLPSGGEVRFDGHPLPRDEQGLRAYRATVGTVFQSYNLFPHLSALENLLLPLVHVHRLSRAEALLRVREPLDRFGLAEHAQKRPAELSGGQKQRIAILRALVVRPRILFLDEPTSALDPEMRGEVLAMIGELKAAGTRFVLVTHEMGFAKRVADEVAFIASGEVVAHGPADTIFSHATSPVVRRFLERILA